MHKLLVISLCSAFVWLACENAPQNKKPDTGTSTHNPDCGPGENPNGQSPLAGMMRHMVQDMDSMRADIMAGKAVDSTRYPMPPFIDAQPTEADMKTPVFYAYAQAFASAYRNMMQQTVNQQVHYNAVVEACRSCHMNFCRGPLKKIEQLPIPE